MSDEEYVRSELPHVKVSEGPFATVVYVEFDDARSIENCIQGIGQGSTSSEAWSAAAEFTRERLEQIRQYGAVELEVRDSEMPQGCIEFILNILNRDLTELRKGMKDQGRV